MSLSCGLVGLSACGKTTIYNAVTAAGAASYDGSEMHRVIVNVPDPRIQVLAKLYNHTRTIPATMQIVDIQGIAADSAAKPGRGARSLKHIKDVDALLHVVRCFELVGSSSRQSSIDPGRDVETVDLELMIADSQTVQNKIDRLSKKVRAGDDDAVRQMADCEKIKDGLDQGTPARQQGLNDRAIASVRECNLVSLKPVLYIANIESMEDAESSHVSMLHVIAEADNSEVITVCGRDEADISQLDPADRQEFLTELGLQESSMERLLRAAYRKLGLVNFFTVGKDEVRAWTCHKGDKAPVAAGKIHTDMERGFIRMEVMRYDDLIELGSEAAVVKTGKQHIEGKAYEVQEGDIVVVLFNTN